MIYNQDQIIPQVYTKFSEHPTITVIDQLIRTYRHNSLASANG